MNKTILAAIAIALVASPAFAAPKAPKAPRAAETLPADYREQIVNLVHDTWKDPYSVRDAKISQPHTIWAGLLGGGNMPGVCIQANAKNSYGAYTGMTTYVTGFRNGRIVGIAKKEFDYTNNCRNVSYVPFKQLNGHE